MKAEERGEDEMEMEIKKGKEDANDFGEYDGEKEFEGIKYGEEKG